MSHVTEVFESFKARGSNLSEALGAVRDDRAEVCNVPGCCGALKDCDYCGGVVAAPDDTITPMVARCRCVLPECPSPELLEYWQGKSGLFEEAA